MRRRVVFWVVAVALVALALSLFGALRWSNPQPAAPAKVDLEAFNRNRVARQQAFIDTVTASGQWLDAPGGVRYRFIEDALGVGDTLRRGDWVAWQVRVALSNDSVCFERPLAFKWQATDVPTGFHDLAGRTSVGDSVEAWLPAHMAWGLTGYQNLIPPDAIIHLNYRWHAEP
jgi:hypothetical protein